MCHVILINIIYYSAQVGYPVHYTAEYGYLVQIISLASVVKTKCPPIIVINEFKMDTSGLFLQLGVGVPHHPNKNPFNNMSKILPFL